MFLSAHHRNTKKPTTGTKEVIARRKMKESKMNPIRPVSNNQPRKPQPTTCPPGPRRNFVTASVNFSTSFPFGPPAVASTTEALLRGRLMFTCRYLEQDESRLLVRGRSTVDVVHAIHGITPHEDRWEASLEVTRLRRSLKLLFKKVPSNQIEDC